MSKRQLKADDVDGFMLAVWDSIVDLEKQYGVAIDVSVRQLRQRGHVGFRAHAYKRPVEGDEQCVAYAEAVWPTHYAVTVHALLYGLLVRLWRELDTWRSAIQAEDGPAPVE